MARDQLSQVIKIAKSMCDSNQLPSNFVDSIKSLFTVAINISGYQVRANVVYFLGSDIFAIAEIGWAQLPISMSKIHDALNMIRLVLHIKVRFPISLLSIFCVNLRFSAQFNLGTIITIKTNW